jgi:hypothetical protein
MDTNYLTPIQRGGSKKRFEARWFQEDTVEEMIMVAWARAKARGEGPTFSEKISDVHEDLHKWDKEVLKNLKKEWLILRESWRD